MTELEYNELANLLYPNTKDISFYFNKYKKRTVAGEVTRLAPSPTGYLHIGQLYQALVHYLLAKKTNGVYYMRLEDTDGKREVKNAGDIAYNMLTRFNLMPSEGYRGDNLSEVGEYGPYVQSNRIEIYNAFAHELVKRGRAFPCFCSASEDKNDILERREEELNENNDISEKDPCRDLTLDEIKANLMEGKPFALRLKSNGDSNKAHEMADIIKGKKEVRENEKDIVLIKSNGVPVYAFAHIVDDTLMGTTTIVRGQEWYQSVPAHVELARAFGFKPFKYAHTPNICVMDEATGNKRKISKRKDSFADVRYFLKTGYPVKAVIEYLLNLLNSDFELWRRNNPTLSYLDFPFDIKKIGVTNPMFDFVKLNDVSKTIISRYTADEVYEAVLNWAEEWSKESVALIKENKDRLIKVFSIDRGTLRPRKDITYFSEILSLYDYILPNFKLNVCEVNYGAVDKAKLKKYLTEYKNSYTESTDNFEWFDRVKTVASKYDFVDNKTYKASPSDYAGNISDATKFIRLAITGKENSPELYSIMKILGVNECKKRINDFINIIK